MTTLVNVSEHGEVVADSKALEFAEVHAGKAAAVGQHRLPFGVAVGTLTMLTAFRVLRMRGTIRKLQVTFNSGPIIDVDENGQLSDWPHDKVADAYEGMLLELSGWKPLEETA